MRTPQSYGASTAIWDYLSPDTDEYIPP